MLNDLWRFDTDTELWGWMGGNSEIDVTVPGPKDTPSKDIPPSGTSFASPWISKPVGDNFFYIGFGGKSTSIYSDEIWRFDTNSFEWTLMKANEDWDTNMTNRTAAAIWGSDDGSVWIFGGEGYDTNGNKGMTIYSKFSSSCER